MMHGGLSKKHMDLILSEPAIGGQDLEHLVAFVNDGAKAYFDFLLRCFRGQDVPTSECPRFESDSGDKEITDPNKLMYLRAGTDDLNYNAEGSPYKVQSDRVKTCFPQCEAPFFMNDKRESG